MSDDRPMFLVPAVRRLVHCQSVSKVERILFEKQKLMSNLLKNDTLLKKDYDKVPNYFGIFEV